jgi:hypothetical protein
VASVEDRQGHPSSQLALSSGGQFSMHADFWNAWTPAAMQWLVDNCLNATRNCTDVARSQIGAYPGVRQFHASRTVAGR